MILEDEMCKNESPEGHRECCCEEICFEACGRCLADCGCGERSLELRIEPRRRKKIVCDQDHDFKVHNNRQTHQNHKNCQDKSDHSTVVKSDEW